MPTSLQQVIHGLHQWRIISCEIILRAGPQYIVSVDSVINASTKITDATMNAPTMMEALYVKEMTAHQILISLKRKAVFNTTIT